MTLTNARRIKFTLIFLLNVSSINRNIKAEKYPVDYYREDLITPFHLFSLFMQHSNSYIRLENKKECI